MPNRSTRNRMGVTAAQMSAAYLDGRDDELLDAAVTAAALIARADGRVEPVERRELLEVLARTGLLSVFTRADIADEFMSRIRQLEEHKGADAALDYLRQFAGRSPARVAMESGERVAVADRSLHPAELDMLRLLSDALGRPPRAASAEEHA